MVKKGDKVTVDYVGSLKDGTVFDTSVKEEALKAGLPERPDYAPLEFTAGSGQVIKGFDDAVLSMNVGDEKTIEIAPEQAYGPKRDELIVDIPLEQLKSQGLEPKEGLMLSTPNGMQGTIMSVGDVVKVDFNHALAGKTLVFKITLRNVKEQ